MILEGADIGLTSGGKALWAHNSSAGTQGFHSFERNVGIAFQGSRVVVSTYNVDLHAAIEATQFVVVSDPRLKSDVTPVKGALAVVRAVPVYDYDMEGVLPRKSTRAALKRQDDAAKNGEPLRPKAERARGVMADALRDVLPDAVHEDEDGLLAVSLYDLTATLMAAIQELDARVDSLAGTPPTRK